jgi:hypothetical protein
MAISKPVAVLRGIPKPYNKLTREEKDYQFRLKQMSDGLKKEAHDNNLHVKDAHHV